MRAVGWATNGDIGPAESVVSGCHRKQGTTEYDFNTCRLGSLRWLRLIAAWCWEARRGEPGLGVRGGARLHNRCWGPMGRSLLSCGGGQGGPVVVRLFHLGGVGQRWWNVHHRCGAALDCTVPHMLGARGGILLHRCGGGRRELYGTPVRSGWVGVGGAAVVNVVWQVVQVTGAGRRWTVRYHIRWGAMGDTVLHAKVGFP